MTPQQLNSSLATNFPTVTTGLQQIPAILGRIDALVTAVSQNLVNFRLADAIPTKSLPTTDVEWQFALPAIVAIGAGGLAFAFGDRRRDRQPAAPTQTAVPIDA